MCARKRMLTLGFVEFDPLGRAPAEPETVLLLLWPISCNRSLARKS